MKENVTNIEKMSEENKLKRRKYIHDRINKQKEINIKILVKEYKKVNIKTFLKKANKDIVNTWKNTKKKKKFHNILKKIKLNDELKCVGVNVVTNLIKDEIDQFLDVEVYAADAEFEEDRVIAFR